LYPSGEIRKKAAFEQAIIVKAVAQENMQQFGLEAYHKCG